MAVYCASRRPPHTDQGTGAGYRSLTEALPDAQPVIRTRPAAAASLLAEEMMRSNHAWVLLVAGLGILHAVSPAPAVTAADDPGFRAFLRDFERGTTRFINGDPGPWKANVSQRDDVTLMGGWGIVAHGLEGHRRHATTGPRAGSSRAMPRCRWSTSFDGRQRRPRLHGGNRAEHRSAGRPAGDGADDAARHPRLPQGGRPLEAAAPACRSARRDDGARGRGETLTKWPLDKPGAKAHAGYHVAMAEAA